MTVAVVGAGLVSPGGITPRDHVFFLRASVLAPAPSPFVGADDRRLDVRYCSWLGARLAVAERLVRMARAAVHEAWSAAAEPLKGCSVPLFVCAPRPRPGLTEDDVRAVVASARAQVRPREVVQVWGAAGAFAALRDATERLAAGAEAAVLLAVDSHVHVDCIDADLQKPPSWWAIARQPPSEAAAALLLMEERTAHRHGVKPMALVTGSQIAPGTSTDDDDEIVDGAGMTTALRALPNAGKVHAIYGQYMLDNLRRQEWVFAEARTAARYDPAYANVTVETRLGRLGAAAGLFNLAFGASVLHHDAAEREIPANGSILAWAISREGVRGVAGARRVGA